MADRLTAGPMIKLLMMMLFQLVKIDLLLCIDEWLQLLIHHQVVREQTHVAE